MILPNLPAHLKKNSSCEIIKNKNNNNEVPESIAKGVFTCRICSTAHVTWREFSKHFLKHHGVEPKILLQYKCVPCDLLFQTKEVYLQHNRKCPKGFNQIIKISNTSSTDISTSTDHICSILTQGALRNPGPSLKP